MPTPRILFLIADGARARLVERARETGHFVTIQEIDSRERLQELRRELRASPPARANHQSHPGGHALAQQDFFRSAKEAFAAEVADITARLARSRGYSGVFVAAPSRLIGTLRRRIAGKAALAGELHRDLTKAPDCELSRWLPRQPMHPA